MEKNITLILPILLFLILISSSSMAAEIHYYSDKELTIDQRLSGKCNLKVSGEIRRGDYLKLTRSIEQLPTQEHDNLGYGVCLNSRGGNFSEAIKIAEYLIDKAISTSVLAGDSCLSACAIIFMGGVGNDYDTFFTLRTISPASKLGFHAPSLNIQSGTKTLPNHMLNSAYVAALRNIADVISKLNRKRWNISKPQFPLSLVHQMLRHTGDNYIYIDNIEKIGVWDIQLSYNKRSITQYNLYNACKSAHRWNLDEYKNDNQLKSDGPLIKSHENIRDYQRTNYFKRVKKNVFRITFRAQTDYGCTISINKNRKWLSLTLFEGDNRGGIARVLGSIAIQFSKSLEPSTKLVNLQ